jgi:exopolyphosphatase/pppGpp-phosphohydrolase
VSSADACIRLEARNTVLKFADGDVVTLPLGVGDLARDVLRHDPPTPAELERAIDVVEDALSASRLPKASRGTLTTSAALLALPGLGTQDAALRLDGVEALFQRLASRALGTPVSADELPQGREMAAALLVLRECMHHLGFDEVSARAD